MHPFVFFKIEKSWVRIGFSEIMFVQAEKKYVTVFTKEKSFLTLSSMNHIEKILPPELFCRIHRSYIVALAEICHFDNELVYIGKRKIPIAEKYLHALKNAVILVNCDKENKNNRKSLSSLVK